MPKPRRKDDEAAAQRLTLRRLRQQVAAELLGVHVRTLRDWNAPRTETGAYDGPDLVKWYLERRSGQADPDPLMNGKSSPALERYRVAKAIEAERNNSLAAKSLVPREDVERDADLASSVIREAVERIERERPELRGVWAEVMTAATQQFDLLRAKYAERDQPKEKTA